MITAPSRRVKRFPRRRALLVAFLMLALVACALPRKPHIAGETRLLMGTEVTVKVVLSDRDERDTAVAVAFAPVRLVDRRMSSYDPDSELMQVNRTAHRAPVHISPHLRRVLAVAQSMADETEGAFDVTCGPIIEMWRNAARTGRVPTDAERAETLKRVGYNKLHLDPEAGTVRFEVAGMKVALGAVAKGYAVDLAVRALRERGYRNALVEAGGDLMAAGSAPGGRPWRVKVQDPRAPDRPRFIAEIWLRDRAVATSGNYRRFSEIAGRRYSHIYDPRTALPVDALPSVTVIAPDATQADALATAVSVLGPVRGMRLIEARRDAECLLVTIEKGQLKLHRSSGFARYEP